jgi:hypothetical protein
MGKKLHPRAPTESFVKQGVEQEIRFAAVPECAEMVSPISAVTSLVRTALANRQARELALIPIRVRCDFADSAWGRAVRATASATEIEVGKKSPAYREMFPDGITPLVVRSGKPLLKNADWFLIHLRTCKMPGAERVLEQWKPKLQQARDALAAALADRKAADAALALARQEEQGARREFNRTIDRMIGQIRLLFPEDRARQDLLFPSLSARSNESGDESETETDPATLANDD